LNLHKKANIIDIGGGDGRLIDYLLHEGYENITVLDISSKALERAKRHLGEEAEKIRWIVSDITDFEPDATYDLWHGRATFHFLTTHEEIKKYIQVVQQSVPVF
jgi:trans-aconitate methyltransferase